MTDLTAPAPPATNHAVSDAVSGAAAAPPVAENAPAAMVAPETAPQPSTRVLQPGWPSVTHTLAFPLTVGDVKLNEIVVAEPDLETLENVLTVVEELGITNEAEVSLSIKQLRPILAALTGIPADALKRLHFRDVEAISGKIGPLLEGLMT